MDVRIGVTQTPKEIELDVESSQHEAVMQQIEQALANENGVLWLTDRRGRRVGVPVAKVAYVEIGSPDEGRRVGFAV